MESLPKIEIIGFEPSSHVSDLIKTNIAKLESHYGRLTSCRVAIKAPGAHHRKGQPYDVSIQLALPGGREVHVTGDGSANDARKADLSFAITDAFHRAGRQLGDDVQKLEGNVRHRRLRSGES